nr:MAG TPA: hypothetical protein [Caudoviricetes sp.]
MRQGCFETEERIHVSPTHLKGSHFSKPIHQRPFLLFFHGVLLSDFQQSLHNHMPVRAKIKGARYHWTSKSATQSWGRGRPALLSTT